jgi:phosphate starvation-inducible membrane PsiE
MNKTKKNTQTNKIVIFTYRSVRNWSFLLNFVLIFVFFVLIYIIVTSFRKKVKTQSGTYAIWPRVS